MGAIGSGYKRNGKKLAAEDVQKVSALEYGAGIVSRPTPTGGERRAGKCGGCGRGVRFLYIIDGVTACERCQNLTRRARQESHTARAELRRDPALLEKALDKANNFIEASAAAAPDLKEWEQSMRIIEAGAITQATTTTPANALNSDIIGATIVPEDATLQQRVIIADISKATSLMERVEQLIESEKENHIDRSGEPSRVPMRIDSLAKLGNLWIGLANLRAARSGVAVEIAQKETASVSTLAQAFREARENSGALDKDGYSLAGMSRRLAGGVPASEIPAGTTFDAPTTSGHTWEVEANKTG